MKFSPILLSFVIAIYAPHMALAGHHEEGEQTEPAHNTPDAAATDQEAESNSEFDNSDSSTATAGEDDGSEESGYSINY